MKAVAEKLVALEKEIAETKGELLLFGLFLREEASGKWDLLVSAPWLQTDKKNAIEFIASGLRKRLTPEELVSLSRIVLLEQDNPGLAMIHKAIHLRHGMAEIENSDFLGLRIRHAYVITSQTAEAISQGDVKNAGLSPTR